MESSNSKNENEHPDGDNNEAKGSENNRYNSSEFGLLPSFGIEISGNLSGDTQINKGLIGSLVQAIRQITTNPLRSVIIKFVESRAEIQIIDDRAKRITQVGKFINIAEVYNRAMINADKIWVDSPEMKEAYLKALRDDYTRQFENLLGKE